MAFESALQPLTPNLKNSRKSLIRYFYKVRARGVIRRRIGKSVKVQPKLSKVVPVNSISKLNFKHIGRKSNKKNWSPVPCTTGLYVKPIA